MEEWRDIKGYEGLYQVSSEGRVRSLDREISDYRCSRTRLGIILRPCLAKGYFIVVLSKEGTHTCKLVHRLVYEAFNGEIPEGMQVNHIDEDKTNNRLDNLNLMTPKENINWGTRNERVSIKTRNGFNNRIKPKQVYGYDKDGNLVVSFPSAAEAGRNGYDSGDVSACARGKYKQHKGIIWKYEKMGDC